MLISRPSSCVRLDRYRSVLTDFEINGLLFWFNELWYAKSRWSCFVRENTKCIDSSRNWICCFHKIENFRACSTAARVRIIDMRWMKNFRSNTVDLPYRGVLVIDEGLLTPRARTHQQQMTCIAHHVFDRRSSCGRHEPAYQLLVYTVISVYTHISVQSVHTQ
jgi:hypothetical protein